MPPTTEPLRRPPVELVEETCRTALQRVEGMPFGWSLNPYAGCVHRCTFCYVRAFERRADRPWGDEYGRRVRVKTNVVEVLRAELARRSWRRELVCLGGATDPYQPAEAVHRLTRGCLEALSAARTPVTLTTRGTLVVRDAALLAAMSERCGVTVTLSVPTLDAEVVARTEPGTPPPRQRLRAVRTLVEHGVRTGVLMAPLLPGITDDARHVDEVVRAARDAGAAYCGAAVLHLRPGTREHFLGSLERHWPELLPRYRALYAGRAHLPDALASPPLDRVAAARRAHGIADRRVAPPRPPAAPVQLPLIPLQVRPPRAGPVPSMP